MVGSFGKIRAPETQNQISSPRQWNRPVKVLVLIPTLEIGGAEMDLVRNLPLLDPNFVVPVVCALLGQAPLSSQLRDAGVSVIELPRALPSARGFYPRLFYVAERSCRYVSSALPRSLITRFLVSGEKFIRTARYVAHCMDEAKVDAVHSILPSTYLVAVMANLLTKRRPVAMSRVSQNWYHLDFRLLGMIERYFLHRRIKIAIGNSQAVLKELRMEGIPEQKLLLIYNGIDAVGFSSQFVDTKAARDKLAVTQDALVLTCVGSLRPRKGHADLITALCLIKDQLPSNWLLLIAGRDVNGNLATLQQTVEKFGLSHHVRLLGERRDIPIILSAADIHISASWHESFPNNILEAMCAGLPVIATAVGGVPEQVIDGSTGLLVPERNPQMLAEAIIALARDIDRRKTMGRAARKRVESEFPICRSANALQKCYMKLGMSTD